MKGSNKLVIVTIGADGDYGLFAVIDEDGRTNLFPRNYSFEDVYFDPDQDQEQEYESQFYYNENDGEEDKLVEAIHDYDGLQTRGELDSVVVDKVDDLEDELPGDRILRMKHEKGSTIAVFVPDGESNRFIGTIDIIRGKLKDPNGNVVDSLLDYE